MWAHHTPMVEARDEEGNYRPALKRLYIAYICIGSNSCGSLNFQDHFFEKKENAAFPMPPKYSHQIRNNDIFNVIL